VAASTEQVIEMLSTAYSMELETVLNYLAFYPSKVDACYVDVKLVRAQKCGFYGGWITESIVGPFKSGPETMGW
jgi:hypothetical protein